MNAALACFDKWQPDIPFMQAVKSAVVMEPEPDLALLELALLVELALLELALLELALVVALAVFP
jgi:hypothetical protein